MDAAAAKRWGRLLAPVIFATAIWLNQGVPRARFLAMLETIKSAPSEHVALAAWYPFAFLYHRAIDEQMYFEISGAMLGRETDRAFMHEVRGDVPPPFDRPLPPADGKFHAPYTEVPLEYPPAAVPLILLPRLFTDSFPVYAKLFGALMAAFLVGAFALIFAALRAAGEPEEALSKRAWLAALLCVLEGSLVIQRLDAVAAFFLALAFYAAVKRNPLLLGFAGGAAFAVKFVPALLLPVLLAADPAPWKELRNWAKAAATAIVAVALLLGPIALAPGAFSAMLAYHGARGLQIETSFATILGVLRLLGGGLLGGGQSFGSSNLSDPTALLLAKACTPLTLLAIAGVAHFAFYTAKREAATETPLARTERMARALFSATVLLWLASKVLSPQYFTWGLPLVLALPFAAGKKPFWTFAGALLVTQIYMRAYYESVANQEPIGIVTMVLRQGLLAAAAAITLWPLVRPLPKPLT
ncbi:MAG TPA: glycosyltransferase 87 family protein [Polyangiaceae bacterium]